MNPELQKELLARLDAIAQKLGIASASIWSYLIRQQSIDGTFYLAGALACLIVIVLAWRAISRFEETDDRVFCRLIVAAFLGAVFLGLTYAGTTSLLNPGYGALQSLMHMATQ